MTTEYFYLTHGISDKPVGVVKREQKTSESSPVLSYINKAGEWVESTDLGRYFFLGEPGLEPTTEAKAKAIIKTLTA